MAEIEAANIGIAVHSIYQVASSLVIDFAVSNIEQAKSEALVNELGEHAACPMREGTTSDIQR